MSGRSAYTPIAECSQHRHYRRYRKPHGMSKIKKEAGERDRNNSGGFACHRRWKMYAKPFDVSQNTKKAGS
jgi:hypothetical protein